MSKIPTIAWAIVTLIGSLSINIAPAQAILLDQTEDPIGGSSSTAPSLAGDQKCDDVQFIFARGSGEALNGPSSQAWRQAIEQKLSTTRLEYSFYELGSKDQYGFQYPAVTVAGSFEGYSNLLGAVVNGGESFDFGKSVTEGANELRVYLRQVSASCPKTKFVLGGYSQGAMVLSRTLDKLDASHILYVATFGDPKLYLPEGKGLWPDACYGKNLSNYRAYVPDCRAFQGVLGGYQPYQPEAYLDKLGAWCNQKDIMCSSGMSIDDHTAYVKTGLYTDAARKIYQRLKEVYPNLSGASQNPWAAASHDVAFLLDTTESMSSLFKVYLSEAKYLASQVLSAGGRIALYTYGDLSDGTKPVQRCNFGCTLTEFSEILDGLKPWEGGDLPESALSAMLTALNGLDWHYGATKSIVLVTDAGYHNPDRDQTTLDDVVRRSLEIDPVNVYVMTERSEQKAYLELARRTGGQVFNVRNADDKTASTETILARPEVALAQAEYSGRVGDEFYFDASLAAAKNPNLRYDWDLDCDGEFELQNVSPTVTQTYRQPISGFVQVRATDSAGHSSTMSARLEVINPSAIQSAIINSLSSQPLSKTSTRLNFQTTNTEKMLLIVNDAVLGFIDPVTRSEIVLENIAIGTKIQLVPYNADEIRGETRELTFTVALPSVPNAGLLPKVH